MKILFITSSLCPGADGVGDYTRDLALECIRQGHTCRADALNEYSLKSDIQVDQAALHELRLSSATLWEDRITRARQWAEQFNPDWISLQFVCFGFHPKGVLLGLTRGLLRLATGFNVHLMLHELWVGGDCEASLKLRLLGSIQKFFILNFIRSLKPAIVNTSNSAYISLLGAFGVHAIKLPLFGAVPVCKDPGTNWLLQAFQATGLGLSQGRRGQYWVFGMFGSLYPVWPPEPLFRFLESGAKSHAKSIVVASIGRMGAGSALWKTLSERYVGRINFINLGARSLRDISEFFQFIDFGISATPFDIIGKSASATAMLEHGVPVIVNRTRQHYHCYVNEGEDAHPLIVKTDEHLPDRLHLIKRGLAANRLSSIGEQFLPALAIESFSHERKLGLCRLGSTFRNR